MVSKCQGCGASIRKGRLTICRCQRVIAPSVKVSLQRPKREPRQIELPCIHRGELVGQADCGCAGKPAVHWCNSLEGHCTQKATGKPWTKTLDGVQRIGNLKPCLVCSHRSTRQPSRALLNRSIPKWHYITVEELSRDVMDMIPMLPPISGVAGVPVSGMSAWLIASALHVPLYQASFQNGLQPLDHGLRGKTRAVDSNLPILILDDTVSSGYAMAQIKRKLPVGRYLFASVYAKRAGMHEIDFYGAQFEEPHLLEHNIANTGYYLGLAPDSDVGGAGIAADLDGVISQDPPRVFDERNVYDKQAYLEWIANAPLGPIVPRMYEVPLIVSYRCEYARKATEHWLAKNGVRYKELKLWPDSVSARTFDGHWKARLCRT